MIPDLLFRAVDVLIVGISVVFLFLLALTVLTKILVALFPEQSSHAISSRTHNLSPTSHDSESLAQPLTNAQQAAIAVAVHRYREQHKQEGKLL